MSGTETLNLDKFKQEKKKVPTNNGFNHKERPERYQGIVHLSCKRDIFSCKSKPWLEGEV